jgi:putative transposase
MSDPFADDIDDAHWDEACRRADAIRSFLARNSNGATAAEVADLAADLSLSQATAYRLIKLFRAGGTVLSLIDRKRGRPEGHRTLDEKREEIIRSTINAFYLKRTRPTVSQLVRDVQTNCFSAGLKAPHRRTIIARLEDIDLQKRARRRGEQKVVKSISGVAHYLPIVRNTAFRPPTVANALRLSGNIAVPPFVAKSYSTMKPSGILLPGHRQSKLLGFS